jgi:regulator of replication initiation timing
MNREDTIELLEENETLKAEVVRLRVELDKYRGQTNQFGAESASNALATVRETKEETK